MVQAHLIKECMVNKVVYLYTHAKHVSLKHGGGRVRYRLTEKLYIQMQ